MPGRARKLIVTERQQAILQSLTRSGSCPQAVALRARMILLAFDGLANEDIAGQVIGDMENPQIGDVNLISFDPHPNLVPHPYIEWFSARKNHYRIELETSDAWIVPASEAGEIDRASRTIREALAARVAERPTQEPTEWV